ncbi:ABC transporter substrate-binding protein [Salicibibacter halophilus]|nr:ABC transporter substrate-binding protein [Salicibibacter halophilus]
MGKKAYWLFLAMVLTLGLLAACNGADEDADTDAGEEADADADEENGDDEEAAGEPQEGGEVIVAQSSEPETFLSPYVQGTESSEMTHLIHEPLYAVTPEIDLEPELAADEYELSDDGLEYTVPLRDDVYFHDGEQMTADDVVYTYELFIDEDYTGPRAETFQRLESVEATDDFEVVFTLSEPDAAFELALIYDVHPEHIMGDVDIGDLEEHEQSVTEEAVGTGPFEITDWDHGTSLTLEAFDDHYEKSPLLDTVMVQFVEDDNAALAAFETQEVDFAQISEQDADTGETIEHGDLTSTLGYNYEYIGWNNDNELFEDPDVRRALTMSIDRESIVEAVLMGHGEVAHFPHSPLSDVYTDEIEEIPYDPEGALELFAEAGWEMNEDDRLENEDGELFEFEMVTNNESGRRVDAIVVIQQMLDDVGITMEPQLLEWGAYMDTVQPPDNDDFDAMLGAWALGVDPTPEYIFHSEEAEQGLNYINYESDEFDETVEPNRDVVDPEDRIEILQDAHTIITEDQPYSTLYYYDRVDLYNDRLEGYETHPDEKFYNLHEWWIDE